MRGRGSFAGLRGFRRISVGARFGMIAMVSTALVLGISLSIAKLRLEHEDARQSEANARATATRLAVAVQNVFESTVAIVGTTHDTLIAFADRGHRHARDLRHALEADAGSQQRHVRRMDLLGCRRPAGKRSRQREPPRQRGTFQRVLCTKTASTWSARPFRPRSWPATSTSFPTIPGSRSCSSRTRSMRRTATRRS